MGLFGRKSVYSALNDFAINWTFHPEQHLEIKEVISAELKRTFALFKVNEKEFSGAKQERLSMALSHLTQSLTVENARKMAAESIAVGQELKEKTGSDAFFYGHLLCGAFYQASAELNSRNITSLAPHKLVKVMMPWQKAKDLICIIFHGSLGKN